MDITKSEGFARKGIEKISRSVRAYVYLILTCQVLARSNIVVNSAPVVVKALINEGYSIGTNFERYQEVLEHASSKVDFSVGLGIYVFPSNLNLNIGRTKGYNNKILVSNIDIKIGSNRDINKDHKKLTPRDVPKK